MVRWLLACDACHQIWERRTGHISDHERQAIEARPCPGCGAYTLACKHPQPTRRKHRTKVHEESPPHAA